MRVGPRRVLVGQDWQSRPNLPKLQPFTSGVRHQPPSAAEILTTYFSIGNAPAVTPFRLIRLKGLAMLPFDASFPHRVAVELREIAEREPTFADELRRMADDLDRPATLIENSARSSRSAERS